MREEGNVITIASKISRSNKEKLHAIADDLGLTFYAMVQACLLTIIRYWDKGCMLSSDHRNMIEAFGIILKSTIGSFNPISCRNKNMDKIKGAIYLVERKTGQRPQLLEVRMNEQGGIVESYNYDSMLSAFLGAIDPDALQCLEYETKKLGLFSTTQTLRQLIYNRSTPREDAIGAEIDEMFNDIRITTGQAINEDIHYKESHRTNLKEYTTITQNKSYRADI